MASRNPFPPVTCEQEEATPNFTTNEEDQREAAKLQARLATAKSSTSSSSRLSWSQQAARYPPIPHVQIAEGAHKYVLIRATANRYRGDGAAPLPEYFVTSKRHAHYHRNAAEPMVEQLEAAGYQDIRITGGGRISYNPEKKQISIYGFSYSFGLGK